MKDNKFDSQIKINFTKTGISNIKLLHRKNLIFWLIKKASNLNKIKHTRVFFI